MMRTLLAEPQPLEFPLYIPTTLIKNSSLGQTRTADLYIISVAL